MSVTTRPAIVPPASGMSMMPSTSIPLTVNLPSRFGGRSYAPGALARRAHVAPPVPSAPTFAVLITPIMLKGCPLISWMRPTVAPAIGVRPRRAARDGHQRIGSIVSRSGSSWPTPTFTRWPGAAACLGATTRAAEDLLLVRRRPRSRVAHDEAVAWRQAERRHGRCRHLPAALPPLPIGTSGAAEVLSRTATPDARRSPAVGRRARRSRSARGSAVHADRLPSASSTGFAGSPGRSCPYCSGR
jgi:hypothetical protein